MSQRGKHDKKLHPCAFFSHQLTPTQRNYDIGNRELLAIKMALEEWRHWLEGARHPFLIWTDHKNLTYIQEAKRLNARQARWALFFNRFNFVVSYRPGSKNQKPDALSRQFEPLEKEPCPESIVPASRVVAPIQWNLEISVKKAQRHHPDPGNGPPGCLFVPKPLRSKVLQWVHAPIPSGHPGTTKTYRLIQRKFWWPKLQRDVRTFVVACSNCAKNKEPRTPPSGATTPSAHPKTPLAAYLLGFCDRATPISR